MTQLHKRFTDDQVKVLLQGYGKHLLARSEVQKILGIGKTRFFALLKAYRSNPETFSIAYERNSPGRLSATAEQAIEHELLREKAIVEDKRLPISGYNYSALRDRLGQQDIHVSVNTIIDRARSAHGGDWGADSARSVAASLVSLCDREVGVDHLDR